MQPLTVFRRAWSMNLALRGLNFGALVASARSLFGAPLAAPSGTSSFSIGLFGLHSTGPAALILAALAGAAFLQDPSILADIFRRGQDTTKYFFKQLKAIFRGSVGLVLEIEGETSPTIEDLGVFSETASIVLSKLFGLEIEVTLSEPRGLPTDWLPTDDLASIFPDYLEVSEVEFPLHWLSPVQPWTGTKKKNGYPLFLPVVFLNFMNDLLNLIKMNQIKGASYSPPDELTTIDSWLGLLEDLGVYKSADNPFWKMAKAYRMDGSLASKQASEVSKSLRIQSGSAHFHPPNPVKVKIPPFSGAVNNKRNVTERRLMKEFELLQQKREDWIVDITLRDEVITDWQVTIEGPEKTPYEKYLFEITLNCANNYPFKPPEVTWVNKPYHPNIDQSNGKICEQVLGQGWVPQILLMECLRTLRLMLSEADLSSPLHPEIAKEYNDSREEFNKKAAYYCAQRCPRANK